jgi:hypothetical protein
MIADLAPPLVFFVSISGLSYNTTFNNLAAQRLMMLLVLARITTQGMDAASWSAARGSSCSSSIACDMY